MKILRSILIALLILALAGFGLFVALSYGVGDRYLIVLGTLLVLLLVGWLIVRTVRRMRARRRVRTLVQVDRSDTNTSALPILARSSERRMLERALVKACRGNARSAHRSCSVILHVAGAALHQDLADAGYDSLPEAPGSGRIDWYVADHSVHVVLRLMLAHPQAVTDPEADFREARRHWQRLIAALLAVRPNDALQGLVLHLDTDELQSLASAGQEGVRGEQVGRLCKLACNLTGLHLPVHVRVASALSGDGFTTWMDVLEPGDRDAPILIERAEGFSTADAASAGYRRLLDGVESSVRACFARHPCVPLLNAFGSVAGSPEAVARFLGGLYSTTHLGAGRGVICSFSLRGPDDAVATAFNRQFYGHYLDSRGALRTLQPGALRMHQTRQWSGALCVLLAFGALAGTSAASYSAAKTQIESHLHAYAETAGKDRFLSDPVAAARDGLDRIEQIERDLDEMKMPWFSHPWRGRPAVIERLEKHWAHHVRNKLIEPIETDVAMASSAGGVDDLGALAWGRLVMGVLGRMHMLGTYLEQGEGPRARSALIRNGRHLEEWQSALQLTDERVEWLFTEWVRRASIIAPDWVETYHAQLEQRYLTELWPAIGNYEWLVEHVNDKHRDAGVMLRDFWSGTGGYPDGVQVSPAFTATGFSAVHAVLTEMRAVHPEGVGRDADQERFLQWYIDQYFDAWATFIQNFDRGEEALRGRAEWRVEIDRLGTAESPWLQLLSAQVYHVLPIIEADIPSFPPWLVQSLHYYDVLDRGGLPLSPNGQKGSGISGREIARNLLRLLPGSASQELGASARLARAADREAMTNGSAAGLFAETVDEVNRYQASMTDTAHQVGGASTAHADMTSLFSHADDPAEGSGNLANLYAHLRKLEGLIGRRTGETEVAWQFLSGPVQLLRNYLLRESACHVQARWQEDVLAELDGLPEFRRNIALLGSNGVLWDFVDDTIAPFVSRSGSGYSVRRADGARMPFAADFTHFLSRARDNIPRMQDEYRVRVHSRPTSVNVGAAIHPRGNSVTLSCPDGDQTMAGRNFPRDRDFRWHDGCSDVSVIVQLGPHALTQVFRGREGFRRFIERYRSGPQRLALDDFEGGAPNGIADSNVQEIRVEFAFEGYHQYLADMRTAPVVPPPVVAACW